MDKCKICEQWINQQEEYYIEARKDCCGSLAYYTKLIHLDCLLKEIHNPVKK